MLEKVKNEMDKFALDELEQLVVNDPLEFFACFTKRKLGPRRLENFRRYLNGYIDSWVQKGTSYSYCDFEHLLLKAVEKALGV